MRYIHFRLRIMPFRHVHGVVDLNSEIVWISKTQPFSLYNARIWFPVGWQR